MSYGYPPQQQYLQHPQGGWYNGPPQPPADPFRAWYAEQLATLTFNSRQIIQNLSIEALKQRDQNNWAGMQAVSEELEQAILRAPPQGKLPLLYLLDSISKNAGPPYTDQLFPVFLPQLYLQTYRQVDGVTKNKMEEMLKLWRKSGPYGGELYAPGVREAVERDIFGSLGPPQALTQAGVQAELRAFLQQKEDEMAKEFSTGLAKTVNVLVQIERLLSSSQVSQQELVDIKNRINAMKGGLQPSSGQLNRQPMVAPPKPPLPAAQRAFQPRDPYPPPPPPAQVAYPGRPPFQGPPQRFATPPQVPTPPQIHAPLPTMPAAVPKSAGALPLPSNVADILRNLTSSGVLSQPLTPEPVNKKSGLEAYEDMILALNMTVDVFDLTKLSLPVNHLPVRCTQCGERFPEGENTLQGHMDWHFRRNRKERETEGRGAHRRWLPRADAWIHENTEGAGPSEPKPEAAATSTKLSAERLAALKRKWVRAPSDPAKATIPCPICKEQFKPEWSEDEEEWVFMNALNVHGTIYHATCRAEKMSSAVAARLLSGERGVSKSPAPESTPGSPAKSPARLPGSPGSKRKAEDDTSEDAKRVKLEPEEAKVQVEEGVKGEEKEEVTQDGVPVVEAAEAAKEPAESADVKAEPTA